ncbi:hypothetical protein HHK36_006387 [Tetracentron sinense]|uniref:Leucine-rich repeat-containing N-terminal plant-type domain-containing protein n=1 Tax=Tetracentron sinense TaxID=13715 RepID=A0A834ZKS8_TETSI|nr:hypothetical protein HHK36_006387 [Tetracentron sinense]
MKGRLSKCLFLWVLFILVKFHKNNGCLEEERMALLQFKASVNWTKNVEMPLLHSWVEDGGSSNCCVWERVKCNPTTGRVIQLSLDDIRESFMDYYRYKSIWYLNVSVFLPFEELQKLDLSNNYFNGWLMNEGFERLSGLKRLETLNLNENSFNNSILPSLGALTSLKTLFLRANRLEVPIPAHELANLINLEILDLSYNFFVGIIPPFKGGLISLKALHLRDNELNGSLDMQGLCELKNLQVLDLNNNHFSGILPPCLSNMTSLRKLDLSSNQLRGNISSSLIRSLASLEYIYLSHNHFEGTFLFSAFANHSMLKAVALRNGFNKLVVETERPSWVPKFQLKILLLSNCGLNKIPKFLSHQYDLIAIDLSYNMLNGRFPTWLVENNTRLNLLDLRKNLLEGHFLLPPYKYINIYWMDLSGNYFDGELQENMGEILPNLEHLNLSRNALQGDIPSSIGYMRKIVSLDLSNNNFSGKIPEHLVASCTSLQFLKLSNNSLRGQIFSKYFNLSQLQYLFLDNNKFEGNILGGLSKSSTLIMLNIENNRLSGKVPSWLGNFTSLQTLVIRDNFLEGQTPKELSKLFSLRFLDISHNNLSGPIPSLLNCTILSYMHLQGNGFIWPIPESFLNSSSLLTLDIRDNSLSGSVPSLISSLSTLRILLLRGNYLNGPIPNHLCQMNKIGILDLSHNSFSGSIPTCFNNITFGKIGKMDIWKLRTEFFEIVESYPFENLIDSTNFLNNLPFLNEVAEQEHVEFITKSIPSLYEGDILNFMSGLDLSCNHLTGEIPNELGELIGIHALNLSGNHLTGSIPKTLSNLENIESLDLSHNKLSGEVPSELTRIYNLEVFTVAYNNLSGKTLDMKAQFGTFDNKSYEGNPLLCGPPLEKICTTHAESLHKPTIPFIKGNENRFDIDFRSFSASFAGSYIIFLLGFAAILYINPYWRRMWFDLIDTCIHSCFLHYLQAINRH